MTIKYKLKLYSPEIIWTVLAFVTLFIFFASSIPVLSLLLLLIMTVEILILLRRPRKLFDLRLNDFFAVIHYPFSKWHAIFQAPAKEFRLQCAGVNDCKALYRNLSRQMTGLFVLVDSGDGYYRMITHAIIKKRVERLETKEKLKILTCKPAYKQSLIKLQKAILHSSCKKCPDASNCRFRIISTKPRQFYYIEFYVESVQ